MQTNYKIIEKLLRKYSFEFLKVSDEPQMLLNKLSELHPQMIEDAQKPNLLAAAIVSVYLKVHGVNGRVESHQSGR